MNSVPSRKDPRTLVDIAVLDDDYDFRTYMDDTLTDEGLYSVHTYSHPEDLFAAAEKQLPDIVLLDMKMGEFHGDKVLEQLLERWPKLCVIVITGYPSLEDMRATFKLRVFDYLSKPFTLAQLRHTLKNAIDTHRLGRTDPDRLREHLGQRIRLLRVEQDWSLKDLSARSGLSVSQISSIERGAHLPSMESLLSISRAFGKRPSELMASIDF
jgi:DNA-binding NtrC family response regulator